MLQGSVQLLWRANCDAGVCSNAFWRHFMAVGVHGYQRNVLLEMASVLPSSKWMKCRYAGAGCIGDATDVSGLQQGGCEVQSHHCHKAIVKAC